MTSVKQAIELVWRYPEAALLGQLREAFLVQSSGSRVLDEEAIRAVRAAAPFHPIPPWIEKSRLHIIASFEYFDRRVRYNPLPRDPR